MNCFYEPRLRHQSSFSRFDHAEVSGTGAEGASEGAWSSADALKIDTMVQPSPSRCLSILIILKYTGSYFNN